jgi:sugar lactone lactonase YvrE
MGDSFAARIPHCRLNRERRRGKTAATRMNNIMNNRSNSKKSAPRPRAGALRALLFTAGIFAFGAPLLAENPPTYVFQWGSYGTGNGQLEYPIGIAVDSSNNVYVVDQNNGCVEKFSSYGNYLTKIGSPGTGAGQFTSPNAIAIDSDNNVYVVDSGNYRIEKFSSAGAYLTQWGRYGGGNTEFVSPNGIAIDSSNNVYVTDAGNYRIQKFSSAGAYLAKWGSFGAGNGELKDPDAIAVDSSNNVYVSDAGNYRVSKFSSDGAYLTKWGSEGADNGQFEEPDGIAVDVSNNVYVVDAGVGRVQIFSSDGSYLTQWGSPGPGAGQFDDPSAIALNGNGNIIYVANLYDAQVQAFASRVSQLAPYISSQPASQSVVAGVTVSFSVTAIGGEPMTYQWTSNQVALQDATNSSLVLPNVSPADAATYAVLITNSFGNAASTNAVLTVAPALVTTLPATGVGAAGAVLNGSVTIGEDTVVWFNWGADAGYGNSTTATLLPVASGTTNLSVSLSGLDFNTYYYQIVASNASGVVQGDSQSFIVEDREPGVTNCSAVSAADGATLYASVNPNGLDTVVYFQWGSYVESLSNRTTITNIGSGPDPVIVSAAITGLAPTAGYVYQAVASNSLGTAYGPVEIFYSFPLVNVPNENWQSVAVSADGTFMVAVVNLLNGSSYGPVFVSTNSGFTWSQATNAPLFGWQTVACSANGSNIVAASGGGFGQLQGPIYTSQDGGDTWLSNNAPVLSWESVASSADGTKLAAAGMNAIYTSANGGADWTMSSNAPSLAWECIAMSADGSRLAACAYSPYWPPPTNIYTSTNFGADWITNTVAASTGAIPRGWISIASSADGSRLLAASGGNGSLGELFISTNSGTTWSVTATNILSNGSLPWIWVASSADGSRLAALANDGGDFGEDGIWTSTNYGATWASATNAGLTWTSAAMSADGGALVATAGWPTATSAIYVTQTAVAPALNLTASDNGPMVSWLIPSQNFTLQQSFDLSTWTDGTNPPALDLTTLRQQVAIPAPSANSFYRLMH